MCLFSFQKMEMEALKRAIAEANEDNLKVKNLEQVTLCTERYLPFSPHESLFAF